MLVEIICFSIAVFVYFVVYKPHLYWKERRMKCAKHVLPLVGNVGDMIFRRKSMFDLSLHLYQEYPYDRYNGFYQLNRPMLLVRNLELVKIICVKDFDHFVDHTTLTGPGTDFLGKSLLSLRGQKWREMRSTLSPAFTSSKIGPMFVFMDECADAYAQHLLEEKQEVIEFEMKDFFSRFTSDIIASAAFGVKCNSMDDPNNKFFAMGKRATSLTGWQGVKLLIIQMSPSLSRIFKLELFPKSIGNFFKRLVKHNIKEREERGIVRPDFIHLLLEARKGKHKQENKDTDQAAGFATVEESDVGKAGSISQNGLTDDVITAQALLFFFAGFEASSTLCCFIAHELAVNPDVQRKLQNEIDEILEETGGNLTFEALIGMKYFDQVVSECLRLWTPGFQADRMCTKDYIIKPVTPDEKIVLVQKGQGIIIPIAGIHRDPRYFPDPLKFDPERFSDENKSKIIPGTFIPFGLGPRNCIGSRFALLEVKTLFFHLLAKFDFITVKRTTLPLQLSKKKFQLTVDNGFWYGFKARKTTAL